MRPLKSSKRKLPRIDPAPSRVSYRIQRLWLTPAFRTGLRVGAPLVLVFAVVGSYLADEARMDRINATISELRRSVEERPEFMVKVMSVDGASSELAGDIRNVLPIDLPLSSFDLDLEAMRREIEKLDAVQRVDVRVRAGGVLNVKVTERLPAVIWRGPDGLELLDATGHRVAMIDARNERPDLPLIAGDGANEVTLEALKLLTRAKPISERILGLVRIGKRRWDIVLDRNQRILLPEVDADLALDRVIALNDAKDLLARDIERIDFRNKSRPTLKLSPYAATELRVSKGLEVRKDDRE